jgi:UDP-glucose 4-epimerase
VRVLLVGGAGYVGSVTLDQLLQAGHEVTVLDSLVTGHRDAVNPEAELIVGDVRGEEALGRLLASRSFDAVFYYGGFIQAGESVLNPGRYFANNVGGFIALLNAMVAYGVGGLVFSSSAAVYGEPEAVPIPEDHPLRPVNPYGETKLMAERMLPWYERSGGVRYVSLRYFNAAGASELRGEDHRPETHLIPIVLQQALGQREAVSLYGTDYPTPDGTCIRDYVHVSDLAAAHVLALDRLKAGSGVYNLGSGSGFSNRQIIDAAEKVTGKRIEVREEPRRAGDPAQLVASNELARRQLGWAPAITTPQAIIESAWRWHEAHPKGYPS